MFYKVTLDTDSRYPLSVESVPVIPSGWQIDPDDPIVYITSDAFEDSTQESLFVRNPILFSISCDGRHVYRGSSLQGFQKKTFMLSPGDQIDLTAENFGFTPKYMVIRSFAIPTSLGGKKQQLSLVTPLYVQGMANMVIKLECHTVTFPNAGSLVGSFALTLTNPVGLTIPLMAVTGTTPDIDDMGGTPDMHAVDAPFLPSIPGCSARWICAPLPYLLQNAPSVEGKVQIDFISAVDPSDMGIPAFYTYPNPIAQNLPWDVAKQYLTGNTGLPNNTPLYLTPDGQAATATFTVIADDGTVIGNSTIDGTVSKTANYKKK